MTPILVTGGTGYIGSITVLEMLRGQRYAPVALDNLSRSSRDSLRRIEQITGQAVPFHQVDLCDWEATRAAFAAHPGLQGVIHFAALKSVPESVAQPHLYYENNLLSLNHVHRACREFGVPWLIFSSSCSVYGNVQQLPVREDTPLAPVQSPYAHTKRMGEEMLAQFAGIFGDVQTIALRYFNPVGADYTGLLGEDQRANPNNLVPIVTLFAAGHLPKLAVYGTDYPTRDGTAVRDYIHVTDIAQAHLLALDYLASGRNAHTYELFNLGSGSGVTVLEALKAFEAATGQALNYTLSPRRPGDVAAIYSDSRHAKKRLGWQPRLDVQEMMRSAWAWQQEMDRGASRV